MQKSESIAALAAALSKAQGEMKAVAFDSVNKNPYFISKYASLAAIWDAIRKPLSDNGLGVVQMPLSLEDGKIGVRTILTHSSGEWISTDTEAGALPLRRTKSGEAEMRDNGPQAAGVVITYLRRYSLSALLGLVSDEDDDAESVTDHKPAAKVEQRPQSATVDDALAKKQKVLKAIGAKIWQKEDEHGEMKPDWHRIGKEMNERAKGLGFELAAMNAKQADELIEVFNTILKEEEENGRGENGDWRGQ